MIRYIQQIEALCHHKLQLINSLLPDRTLLSIGLGLRWQYSDRITAQIDWGIPLIKLESSDCSLQEQGIYFLFNWKPF
ncbi:hypothetical protein A19Y_0479 [Planktothrix agardhii NIVA-CYA 126/8]|uniref:Uncharacterized protein n=2 Tax=Planktothrix agardhii TaxID=1160 RepID=A0A073CBH9_PLAA1|nr:hypothetical protein A19Y_0479 [Planktothrix agardhii NIVA-CYA 126/8]CUM60682.1 protein of unknown function [Planktothrix agardhii]